MCWTHCSEDHRTDVKFSLQSINNSEQVAVNNQTSFMHANLFKQCLQSRLAPLYQLHSVTWQQGFPTCSPELWVVRESATGGVVEKLIQAKQVREIQLVLLPQRSCDGVSSCL